MKTQVDDSNLKSSIINDLSQSTLLMDGSESSISTASKTRVVQFRPDPNRPERILATKHRYRKPKNPADLYVDSEEQYRRCLDTRALAKVLRQQLLLLEESDDDDIAWMEYLNHAFAAFSSSVAKDHESILPLQSALEEQVRGLEKEILLDYKQNCAQHRKRHAQKIVLSQTTCMEDELGSLSQKSSSRANNLARLLALTDEHYVRDLLKAEPVCWEALAQEAAVLNEEDVTKAKTTKSDADNIKKDIVIDHPEQERNAKMEHQKEDVPPRVPERKVPIATRSFGRFARKAPKDGRKAPGASRSFTKTIRRAIGNNFRRPPQPPAVQPSVPLVQV